MSLIFPSLTKPSSFPPWQSLITLKILLCYTASPPSIILITISPPLPHHIHHLTNSTIPTPTSHCTTLHHPHPFTPIHPTGALVTAVYDDDSGSGREDDPSALLPETPPPPPPPGGRAAASLVGHVAPFWIPDEDAPNCQECGQKFTVIRRRHHCRACGRVLCAPCCHHRAALPYMDHKEARVCTSCLQILQAGKYIRTQTHTG